MKTRPLLALTLALVTVAAGFAAVAFARSRHP